MLNLNLYKDKRFIKQLYVLFSLCLLAFVFLLKSPFHPFCSSEPSRDTAVFQTVALMMENGFAPYRDTFDHKGPLLYLIYLLGNKISDNNGVFFIEFFSLLSTLVFCYKVARLKSSPIMSLIITVSSVVSR